MRLWISVAGLGVVGYGVASLLGAADVVFALKGVPVALLGVGAARETRGPGATLAVAGLLTSALADVLIEIAFLAGLGTFLVAHLLYIAAFTRAQPTVRASRAAPFALVFVGLGSFFALSAGPLGPAIAAYALVISVMGWRAAARVERDAPATWAGLVGAGLFIVSDSLIAVNRFVTELPLSELWVLGTYWPAQALLASSFAEGRAASSIRG